MAVLTVGKNKDYKTISSAIEASSSGDEIIVEPNVYAECLEINKELYIHSSLDLTKAKNNFSSEDVPIIYIKSFETLKITAKCRIENLLFTQRKDLTFGLLSEVLVRAENDCEITGDKIIHDLENEEFGTMLEISNDLNAKNCFFVFAAYHGVSIIKGTSVFERSIFSNSYADDIFVSNDSILKLDNKCFVRNTINGYGIYAKNQSNIEIKDSTFINNECSSIEAIENCNVFVSRCELTTSQLGITADGKSIVKISDCDIRENLSHGIQIAEKSNVQIDNCSFSKNKKNGLIISEKSFCHISNSNFIENNCGISILREGNCEGFDVKFKKNITAGIVLNDFGKIRISNSLIENNAICLYSQDEGKCLINNSELGGATNAGFYLRDNSSVEVNDCKIHDCLNGVYAFENAMATIMKSDINKNTDAFYLTENSTTKVIDSNITKNKSNAFYQSDNSTSLIESSIISENEYGFKLNDSAKSNCYKTKIIDNREAAINAAQNTSGNYIHCEILDNKNGYFKWYGATKYESFINCHFSNDKDYHENEKKCIRNVSKSEEEKLYNQIFNLHGSDIEKLSNVVDEKS